MKLSKNKFQKHLEKLIDLGIDKVKLNSNGAYVGTNIGTDLCMVAPEFDGFEADNDSVIYGVNTLVKIVKAIESPDGYIDMDISDTKITLETSSITYNFALSDSEALSGVLNTDAILEVLKSLKFTDKYEITASTVKNILNSLSILDSEHITFKSTKKGFDMIFGSKQVHNSLIHVIGKNSLSQPQLLFDGKSLQMIFKSLSSDETVYLEFAYKEDGDEVTKVLKIYNEDGYTYYVTALTEI